MNYFTWKNLWDLGSLLIVVIAGCVVGIRTLKKSVDPAMLAFKWVLTVVLVLGTMYSLRMFPLPMWPIVVLIPAMTVGLMWAPSVGGWMAKQMSGDMDGGDEEIEAKPLYSAAEFKRRNSQYEEAARLVIEQLEKFPDDFPGRMLLATIQAEDLHDLPGAQATLESWITGAAATPAGIASALTALADWHLQIDKDRESARLALERIVQTLPDTPLAHRAAQRLAHLPTAEHLAAGHETAALDLPAAEKNLGLRQSYQPAAAIDADALAETYVKQLEEHPADTDTREKLAVLYAEHFKRLDLATDQLNQLINFPNEAPRRIGRWLNLLADLHIRCGNDLAAAEAALRQIIERFPNTAMVDTATARLAGLRGELKAGQKTNVKSLGTYEKNIGLKTDRHYGLTVS